jgi:hypothetical protein
VQHQMGLPRHVDRITFYRVPDAASGPLFAVVTPDSASRSFDADVVDGEGRLYLHVGGYRTVVFREDVDARVFAPAQTVPV